MWRRTARGKASVQGAAEGMRWARHRLSMSLRKLLFFPQCKLEHLCRVPSGARLISLLPCHSDQLKPQPLRNTRRTSPPDWPASGSSVQQAEISDVRPMQEPVSCDIPRENYEIPNRSCETPKKLVKYTYSETSNNLSLHAVKLRRVPATNCII